MGWSAGCGEKIEIFENNLQNEIMIVKPKFGVSTKVAYEYSDLIENKANANIEEIIFGLKENNLEKVEKNIKNNLEEGEEGEDIKACYIFCIV